MTTHPRDHTLPALLIGLLCWAVLSWQPVRAETAGSIEIKTLNVKAVKNQYLLNADITYQLSGSLQQALLHGVKVNSLLNIYLGKHRSWWWNSSDRIMQIAFQLRYHSLSKQYILTRLDTEQSWNFGNLPRALRHIGIIRDVALPLESDDLSGDDYYIYARSIVSAEKLSFPLKLQSWFNDQYVMESEGFLWSLP